MPAKERHGFGIAVKPLDLILLHIAIAPQKLNGFTADRKSGFTSTEFGHSRDFGPGLSLVIACCRAVDKSCSLLELNALFDIIQGPGKSAPGCSESHCSNQNPGLPVKLVGQSKPPALFPDQI